jgi:hypothetical protein
MTPLPKIEMKLIMKRSTFQRARQSTATSTNKLYRIPVEAAGKAGQPVEISLDQPVKAPGGMRKLLVAENGSSRISVIGVNGDKTTVTVSKEGLKIPTAVEPDGDAIWIAERGAGKALSISMPK